MQPIFTKQDHRKYQCLLQVARKLRKQQTPIEQKFWQYIKGKKLLDVKFHRQQILLNSYIIDFYAPAIKLDGIQHDLAEYREKDILRDNKLNSEGITVKRYSNIMISSNIRLVIKDLYNCIWEELKHP